MVAPFIRRGRSLAALNSFVLFAVTVREHILVYSMFVHVFLVKEDHSSLQIARVCVFESCVSSSFVKIPHSSSPELRG